MNCHEGNKRTQKHSPIRHMLHMVICCGLPILILSLLPLITRLSPGAGIIIGKIAPFICPVMMILMIPMMMGMGHEKKRNCCSHGSENQDNSKQQQINTIE